MQDAETLGIKLGLQSVELEYFLMLVEISHVTSKWAKSLLINEAEQIRRQRTLPRPTSHSMELSADLTTFTIMQLLSMEEMSFSEQDLAGLLHVDKTTVQEAIDKLLLAGFIVKSNSSYKVVQSKTSFKVNRSHAAIERYFNQVLDRAKKELDQGDVSNRVFRTRIAAFPKDRKQEVTTLIDGFLGKLATLMQEWEDKGLKNDDVLCLNINLFGLLNEERPLKTLS